MADLYTRSEVDFGGAMTAEKGMANPEIGVLLQNIQLQYSQNITRLYEIGKTGQKTKIYYIGGRSQGQATLGYVIGPGDQMKAFLEKYGDVCKANANTLQIDTTPNVCSGAGSPSLKSWTAKFCVLINVGLSVAAQDFVINANGTVMFSGLQVA